MKILHTKYLKDGRRHLLVELDKNEPLPTPGIPDDKHYRLGEPLQTDVFAGSHLEPSSSSSLVLDLSELGGRMTPSISCGYNTLYGLKIQITPELPKMVLSEDVPVSPQFREEMNAWMLGFFGTHNILKDGEVIKSGDTLLMNIRTYTDFKARCEPFLP